MILKIIIIIVITLIYIIFNPASNRIRRINKIINKDRSVCDFINSLEDWYISPEDTNGLRILIDPVFMPMYPLYITYKRERPSNDEIKILYKKITNSNSPVTIAHSMNMPYENYANTTSCKISSKYNVGDNVVLRNTDGSLINGKIAMKEDDGTFVIDYDYCDGAWKIIALNADEINDMIIKLNDKDISI